MVESVRSEGGSLPFRRNFAYKGSDPTHHFGVVSVSQQAELSR